MIEIFKKFQPPIAIAILIILATPFVSKNVFTVDEILYKASIDSMIRGNGLFLDNIYYSIKGESSRIPFVIDGPHGHAPQYPIGTTVLGSLFVQVFGEAGYFLTNILSGIATLFVIYALSIKIFRNQNKAAISLVLFSFCTFWMEYVFGIWPHAISLFIVTLIIYLFYSANERNSNTENGVAIGALIGVGILFRIDTILILPALTLLIISNSSNTWKSLYRIGLGVAPFLMASSFFSLIKFDTLNPFSYGKISNKITMIEGHINFIALGIITATIISISLIFASAKLRQRIKNSIPALMILIILIFYIINFHGFLNLFIDARGIIDHRPGVQLDEHGILKFWGLTKKALVQSMPWLGILFFIAPSREKINPQFLNIAILVSLIWMAPFLPTSWHGGLGSNMRYFLPVIPILCIICAGRIYDIYKYSTYNFIRCGTIAGSIFVVTIANISDSGTGIIEQKLSTYLFFALAILSALASTKIDSNNHIKRVAAFFCGVSLATSFFFLAVDFASSQTIRENFSELKITANPLIFHGVQK